MAPGADGGRVRPARQTRRQGPARVSPGLAEPTLAFLKRVFNATIEAGTYSGRNPCEAVSMLSENNARFRFLALEEENALQHAARADVWRLVVIAVDTGLRRAEQFGLRREHVDFRRRQLIIPRTNNGEARHVDLTPRALEFLRQILAEHESEWVFPAAKGDGPATFDSIRHQWEKAVTAAKLGDFHWHDLRHTCASRLVMAGADLVTVKELLGHKTLAMVARYAHLSDGHRKSAIQRSSRL